MAENKNMLAFRGGEKGFVGNYYAIWQNGLDGEEANQWAKRAGISTSIAALRSHSMHGNAIYRQLVDFLWSIQRQEKDKEVDWIHQKLNAFRYSGITPNYLKQVEAAVDSGEIGLAYTLMTQANKDLQELKREVGKNGSSISRLNKFWHAQFEDFFVEKLDKAFKDFELGKYNASLSIEQVFNAWVEELLKDSNVVPSSINFIRSTMEDGLVDLFNKQGITIDARSNLLDVDFKKFVSAKKVKKVKQQEHRSESLNGILSRVRKTIFNGLQKGLSAEMLSIGEGGRGGLAMGGGNIYKHIENELHSQFSSDVQQKSDVISIEAYKTNIDWTEHADRFYQAIQAGGEEGLKRLEDELTQIINDTNDIYIVETNVKGYQSMFDIDFERKGSFYARMNNLYKMRDQFPQKSIDQLIFLLNNTMDECVASHHKDLLGDYFSAIFAAWMWDDYTELFKEMERDNPVKRIRIFNSGGLYFSASQLMCRTLEDLETKAESNSFIYAEITPPSFNPHELYKKLKSPAGGYPVEGMAGGEERQNVLAKRWDAMKDTVMRKGQVSLNIRQKQLDELFGKLASFIS